MKPNPIQVKFINGLFSAVFHFYFGFYRSEKSNRIRIVPENNPHARPLYSISMETSQYIRVYSYPYLYANDHVPPIKTYTSVRELMKDASAYYPKELQEKIQEIHLMKKYRLWENARKILPREPSYLGPKKYHELMRKFIGNTDNLVTVRYEHTATMLRVCLSFDAVKMDGELVILPYIEPWGGLEIDMAWNIVDSKLKLVDGLAIKFRTGTKIDLDHCDESMSFKKFTECVKKWPLELRLAIEEEDLLKKFKSWDDRTGHFERNGYCQC